MPLFFGEKSLSPAPLPTLSISKPEEKAGHPTARTVTLQLRQTLVAYKGSPTSSGTWWTTSGEPPEEDLAPESMHTAILTKQAALRTVLEQQNAVLSFQPWDGALPTKYVVRLRELKFDEGPWFNTCGYVATFDVDLQGVDNSGIDSLGENWQLEIVDENLGTYRLTHAVNAKGRIQFNADGSVLKPAWQHARDYILNTVGLGVDRRFLDASGVVSQGVGLTPYNYNRRQSVDETEGVVTVNEDWLAYNAGGGAAAVHDQNLSLRVDPNGIRTVSVEGTITGLRVSGEADPTPTQSKRASMEAKWAEVQPTLYAAATGVAGCPLHTAPLGVRVQTNAAQGTLTYGMEWNSRKTQFAGALSETISISDAGASEVYAKIPIPFRVAGPILQDLDTVEVRRRSLSIEVQVSGLSQTYTPTQPDTSAFVLSQVPLSAAVFLDQDVITWDPSQGRYSRQVGWSYSS